MLIALQIVFWLCFGLLAWTFAGYPLTVFFLSRIVPRPWRKAEFTGTVSMVIAAHNEEEVIRDKVKNCLNLDFGSADREIIVVSDGSTDGTNAILDEFTDGDPCLQVVTYHPRAGKANALNIGVSRARGDVLIFGDANVMLERESCQALLAPFADPGIGAVCGHVLVRPRGNDEVAGESLYMKYEAAVQRAEALRGSMVGVDGALFAMRREFYQPLPTGIILDDFMLSMEIPAARRRIVYEAEARAVEEVIPSAANEFKRKARIVSGGYQFLAGFLKSGKSLSARMWFAFFSHKILRWFAPFLLLLLFFVNMALLGMATYRFLFVAQCLFYSLASLGALTKSLRRVHVVYIPYYFTVVNLAALQGFFRYLRLEHQTLWEKVER